VNKTSKGFQYVRCVMHKCIMVKAGGNENHIKHVFIQRLKTFANLYHRKNPYWRCLRQTPFLLCVVYPYHGIGALLMITIQSFLQYLLSCWMAGLINGRMDGWISINVLSTACNNNVRNSRKHSLSCYNSLFSWSIKSYRPSFSNLGMYKNLIISKSLFIKSKDLSFANPVVCPIESCQILV